MFKIALSLAMDDDEANEHGSEKMSNLALIAKEIAAGMYRYPFICLIKLVMYISIILYFISFL